MIPVKSVCSALLILLCCAAISARAERVLLPRPELTPGVVFPACTISDLQRKGYSRSVRPSPGFTRHIKQQQLAARYQDRGTRAGCVEEDHLVPIGWCGNPGAERNLWPQLRAACGAPSGAAAEDKDDCEYKGFELLRRGKLDLDSAQKGIAHDWIAYCRDVVQVKARAAGIGAFHEGSGE